MRIMGFESKVEELQPKLSQKIKDVINRSHRDSTGCEQYDDIDSYKNLIMKILTNNEDILWTLHNAELEEKKNKNGETLVDANGNPILKEKLNGDEYRNVNIFPFLKIPDVQSTVKNFICFEVDNTETLRFNESLIRKNIIFRTITHEDDFRTDYGISRQDLLAIIIKTEFDWSNIFGTHITKIYDKGRVAENGYYYREFIYETTTANNLINKGINGGVGYRG